jgi:hypothetical protein
VLAEKLLLWRRRTSPLTAMKSNEEALNPL